MFRNQLLFHSVDEINKKGILDGLNTSFYSVIKMEKTMFFTRFFAYYQNKTNKVIDAHNTTENL